MRLLLALFLFFAIKTSAFAAAYGMAGCGLGSLIITDNNALQIFASTSNVIALNTSSMTSGISNCTTGKAVAVQARQEHFVAENIENIRTDMVKGDGEYLRSYAEILGCKSSAYPKFQSLTREKITEIFSAPGSVAILEKTKEILGSNTDMLASCNHLT